MNFVDPTGRAQSTVTASATPEAAAATSTVVPVAKTAAKPRRFRWLMWVGLPVGGIGLFFMLLVPTMCASREGANRIKCSSNLRQLGMAMFQFADAHSGQMPSNWQDVAMGQDVTSDVFICAASNTEDRVPGTGADSAKSVAVWSKVLDDPATHHNSYRYAANGLRRADLTEQDIIAFEPAENHAGDGVNLLLGDGHVEWQPTSGKAKPTYDRLLADHAAGVRPLRWRP